MNFMVSLCKYFIATSHKRVRRSYINFGCDPSHDKGRSSCWWNAVPTTSVPSKGDSLLNCVFIAVQSIGLWHVRSRSPPRVWSSFAAPNRREWSSIPVGSRGKRLRSDVECVDRCRGEPMVKCTRDASKDHSFFRHPLAESTSRPSETVLRPPEAHRCVHAGRWEWRSPRSPWAYSVPFRCGRHLRGELPSAGEPHNLTQIKVFQRSDLNCLISSRCTFTNRNAQYSNEQVKADRWKRMWTFCRFFRIFKNNFEACFEWANNYITSITTIHIEKMSSEFDILKHVQCNEIKFLYLSWPPTIFFISNFWKYAHSASLRQRHSFSHYPGDERLHKTLRI